MFNKNAWKVNTRRKKKKGFKTAGKRKFSMIKKHKKKTIKAQTHSPINANM